jgi:mRNA interferase RelE/StbE
MSWAIEFTASSRKDLQRLSTADQRRITDYLQNRVASHENPRALAKRLSGIKEELWRFRVGDYRIIAQFHQRQLIVLVMEIGHRGDVYR